MSATQSQYSLKERSPSRNRSLAVTFLFALTCSPFDAFAARLPTLVDKVFTFEGASATEIASLFRLPTDEVITRKFPRDPNSWVCRSDSRGCGALGESYLTITFRKLPIASLTLAGEWLDAESGSIGKVPQFVIEESFPKGVALSSENSWREFLPPNDSGPASALPLTTVRADPYMEKKVETSDGRLVMIKFYYRREGRIDLSVGVDERSIADREKRMKSYQACIENVKATGLDSGC